MNVKHRMSHSPTYESWHSMITRCHNPKYKRWADYGGRGIQVCKRWKESFAAFYADMGERPIGMSLDRVDGNAGYSPENCRWATRSEQQSNRRNNVYIDFKGKRLTVAQWSREVNICAPTISDRLRRGLPAELIFAK